MNRLVVGSDAPSVQQHSPWLGNEFRTGDRVAVSPPTLLSRLPSYELSFAMVSPKLGTIFTSFGYDGRATGVQDQGIRGVVIKPSLFPWYMDTGIRIDSNVTRLGRVGLSRVIMKGAQTQISPTAKVILMAILDSAGNTNVTMPTVPQTMDSYSPIFLLSTNYQVMKSGGVMMIWNFDACSGFWSSLFSSRIILIPIVLSSTPAFPGSTEFSVSTYTNSGSSPAYGVITGSSGVVSTTRFPFLSLEFGFTPEEYVEQPENGTSVPILSLVEAKTLLSFVNNG